jgi:DNA-binding MarR family transcriptional regulator
MPEYVEEPTDEFKPEITNMEDTTNAVSIAKLISKRKSAAVIVKWLLSHSSEPHINGEISEGIGMNVATVGSNLQKLVAIGVVEKICLDTIDKRSRLYRVKPKIGALITKRYLWLASWKLLKALGKTEVRIERLKSDDKFLDVCKKFYLSFEESLDALRLNHYVEVLNGRDNKPYAIKLKDLPPYYYKEEKTEVEKPVAEEIF